MMRWLIFYDDGSRFSSDDGEWKDAPTDGVLFVLEQVGDRIVTHSGSDHYIQLEDGGIVCTEDLGPLLRKWGVKFGRWTSIKRYEEIGRLVAVEAAQWPR